MKSTHDVIFKKKKKSTTCITIPIDETAFYMFSGLVLLLKKK